jgi:hypothetical protein
VTRRRVVAAWALALAGLAGGVNAEGKGPEADRCQAAGSAPGPGTTDPFRTPALAARELNAAGKVPYRQGKWEEARAQYRAALAADPEFLAPKLNIASSFVRQERFAEATAEVLSLLDGAYVPWAREIREAADLGALKVRPEWKDIERAMAASATRWGEGLDASVIFVARQSAPLRVPEGPGVFLLNPHQEVWAYTPRTGRYRQLTAEDGHVVALARSSDGRRIAYVTAEKLVRGAAAGDVALRGVALHELALATMSAAPVVRRDDDLRRLEIFGDLTIDLPEGKRLRRYRNDGRGALVPAPSGRRAAEPLVSLTGAGAVAGRGASTVQPCALPAAARAGGGAGIVGLPLP